MPPRKRAPAADSPAIPVAAPPAATPPARHPNLRPWRPGQSGNPKGRPRLRDLREVLVEALSTVRPDGRTALETIVGALMDRAARGDTRAAEVLMDRAWGRPAQRTDVAVGVVATMVPPIAWIDGATGRPALDSPAPDAAPAPAPR